MTTPRAAGEYVIHLPDDATITLTSDGRGRTDLESDGLKYEEDGDPATDAYNAAIDGVESLVLAQWAAGIDVTSEAYRAALEKAVEELTNNLG